MFVPTRIATDADVQKQIDADVQKQIDAEDLGMLILKSKRRATKCDLIELILFSIRHHSRRRLQAGTLSSFKLGIYKPPKT
jgi:hypothetical protein